MEKIVVVLCIAALSVATVDGYVEFTGVEVPSFTSQDDGGGDGPPMSKIETVTIPENKLREVVHYDHIIRIEFYFGNKSSGEWVFWALDVSGQELIKIPGIATKPDGFGEDHSVMHLRRELSAQFTVLLDDSEGESITADGEYDVQRDEYVDLSEEIVLRIDTNANISVDELPSTNIPLSFRGFMRSYFDPHLPKLETLEDSIYGEGQTINLGQTGEWVDETTWTQLTYDWVAERGEIIAGYETILINVSTDFGDDDFSVPFKELIWISNEVSAPVKQFIHTNTSWDGEEEIGYILLENTFKLRENGYTEGAQPIPWNTCNGFHWLDEHPWGETETWKGNYMPKSGSDFDESSFHWKPEEVIEFLEVEHPSDGLELYLSDFPEAIIIGAKYNASVDTSDPEDKAGEFWWNLTFGSVRRSDQTGSSWNLENRYRVLVYNNTEWYTDPTDLQDPIKHTVEKRLELDIGKSGGTSPLAPDDIKSQTITMASSEKIFKTDDKVMEAFYPYEDLGITELDWGDGDETEYSLGASSGQQGFGMDLIATLTGIQTQTWSKYYWSVEKEDLMEGGSLASASLDAETGRLIGYMEIEGTALQNAFKFGD